MKLSPYLLALLSAGATLPMTVGCGEADDGKGSAERELDEKRSLSTSEDAKSPDKGSARAVEAPEIDPRLGDDPCPGCDMGGGEVEGEIEEEREDSEQPSSPKGEEDLDGTQDGGTQDGGTQDGGTTSTADEDAAPPTHFDQCLTCGLG